MTMRPLLHLSLWCLTTFAAGCYFVQRAKTPMPVERFAPHGPAQARGAMVFMPGFLDGPQDFVKHGFVDLVHEQARGYDVFAANAHFRYYAKGRLWTQLEQEVIAPLLRDGYKEVWLVGISMGGFGSLSYAVKHPEQVRGLILLAPYLGPSELIDEISAAGGVESWQPGDLEAIEDEEDRLYRTMWAWIRQRAVGESEGGPTLFLGYGNEDQKRFPDGLLGKALNEDQVAVRPGGHKWVVWKPLFKTLLRRAFPQAEARP